MSICPSRPRVIERCQTPRGELQLQRRGDHYEIISNGAFLMATYNAASARHLVTAALAAALQPRRVLIAGLGVGISLGAALADPRVARAYVVEIEERVIAWNRRELALFSGHALDDPRTSVVHADILDWLPQGSDEFDVICLDVDNGPDWTVTEDNRALYTCPGLRTVRRRLAPGGALAVWSATASPAFAARLSRLFGDVRVLSVPQDRGGPDYIYLTTLPSASDPSHQRKARERTA